MDIYSLFIIVFIVVLLITIKIALTLNRKYLNSIKNKILTYIAGLISSIIIVALFYGILSIIFQTPTQVKDNIGSFTFVATNTDSITLRDGTQIFRVTYTTNEADEYNSFVQLVDSKEDGQKLVKDSFSIDKQIFIDSTSAINYVDKDVTEEEFIAQQRRWIINWIVAELILSIIVISLNVLVRRDNILLKVGQ